MNTLGNGLDAIGDCRSFASSRLQTILQTGRPSDISCKQDTLILIQESSLICTAFPSVAQ